MPTDLATASSTYNYNRFRPSFYDLASFDGPSVGEPVPTLQLWTADGQPCRLDELGDGTIVIETGSVTCPMFVKGIPAMNRLVKQYPDVTFAVLYVREAHPGERTGPHVSDGAKRNLAATVSTRLNDDRLVLVDDVAGTAHRALGLLPNMVYVIGPDGRVTFRGDWNNPEAVEAVLNGTAGPYERAREHFPPTKPSPSVAVSTLLRGGWQAVLDFAIGLPSLLAQHRRADRLDRARSR